MNEEVRLHLASLDEAKEAILKADAPIEDHVKELMSSKIDTGLLLEPDFLRTWNRRGYRLFVDMDGVLTDWKKQYLANGGRDFKKSEDIEWSVTDNFEFWSTMDWMPKGKELWDSIKHLNPVILSSPGRSNFAREGKTDWIKRNLGENITTILDTIKEDYADSRSILIDDMEKNTIPWAQEDGIGILYGGRPSSALRKIFVACMDTN